MTRTQRAVALRIEDGAIAFGARVGLRHVTLSVSSGERVAVIGPSGVGKSSLLRAIAGLDEFSQGRLYVLGADVTDMPPEVRRCVYLHQTPALFPHLSVRDNVAFPFRLRGASRASSRAQAQALLDRLHLSPLADRAPERLSGGERHRTALARALAADPAVLLLDEPFAALDPSLRDEIRHEVLTVLSALDAPAMLLVTHDIEEAARMTQRTAVLLDGTVVQADSTATVLDRPATRAVANLLGMPNVIPGARDETGTFACALGCWPSSGAAGLGFAVGWADLLTVSHADDTGVRGIVIDVEHHAHGRLVRVQLDSVCVAGRAAPQQSFAKGEHVSLTLALATPHVVVESARWSSTRVADHV